MWPGWPGPRRPQKTRRPGNPALVLAKHHPGSLSGFLAYMFGPGLWWCSLLVGMEGCAMGQVLHGSARTTAAVRRAIQHSQESLRSLAYHESVWGMSHSVQRGGRGIIR